MVPYIILGVIQGLTEFFPVSSSAHLAIIQRMFGLQQEAVAVSVILHLGTTFALVLFFFRDIIAALRDRKTLSSIAVTTLVTGLIGVSGKKFFEQLFTMPAAIGGALIITGIILFATVRCAAQVTRKDVNLRDAFILGITQGFAIIPGISRSGITISTLLFRGIQPQKCFSFSFIAAIPAIIGAAALEARHIEGALSVHPAYLLAGFMASFTVGLCALALLKALMQKARIHYFGFYCIAAGLLVLLFVK